MRCDHARLLLMSRSTSSMATRIFVPASCGVLRVVAAPDGVGAAEGVALEPLDLERNELGDPCAPECALLRRAAVLRVDRQTPRSREDVLRPEPGHLPAPVADSPP